MSDYLADNFDIKQRLCNGKLCCLTEEACHVLHDRDFHEKKTVFVIVSGDRAVSEPDLVPGQAGYPSSGGGGADPEPASG